MTEDIVRYNVRMPAPVGKVFDTFAALFGYKKSTFIFVCALDGLLQKAGRQSYLDVILSLSGSLLPEPSVDAQQKPEG